MFLTVISFILVLSVLVFVHELGHYLAARHVGVRVERFSIGFPPKAFGKTVGETEYVLSWLPLGGYVKLFGQNLDDEDPGDPANYASKTKMQRVYILLAGPVMNLVVAFALMPLVYIMGVDQPAYRQEAPVIFKVAENSSAEQASFKAGDTIVALNGQETPTWNDVYKQVEEAVISGGTAEFTVLRDGGETRLQTESSVFAATRGFGWVPLVSSVVGAVSAGYPAEIAGLKQGDQVLSISGEPVDKWQDLSRLIQSAQGAELDFRVKRGEEVLSLALTPKKSGDRWLVGVSPGRYKETFGVVDSIKQGSVRLWEIFSGTFRFLGQMITGQGSLDALGGPVKIGVVIGEAARSGVADVLFLMAVISLQLGIFNLLPIPALDGGHITLLAVEALSRKPLSAKIRERAQMIGFSLLIMLILVVTFNDITQMFN